MFPRSTFVHKYQTVLIVIYFDHLHKLEDQLINKVR